MEGKSMLLGSIGALTLALGGSAFAAGEYGAGQAGAMDPQSGQMSSQQPMAGQQAGAGQMDLSDQYRASNLEGLAVRDSQGEEIGNINHVLVGQDGKVSNVVVSRGGMLGVGSTNYLVPWDRLNIDPQQRAATIDISGDQLDTEFSAFEELPETALEQDAPAGVQDEGVDVVPSEPGTTNEQPFGDGAVE